MLPSLVVYYIIDYGTATVNREIDKIFLARRAANGTITVQL
jgi:hypothetical protein